VISTMNGSVKQKALRSLPETLAEAADGGAPKCYPRVPKPTRKRRIEQLRRMLDWYKPSLAVMAPGGCSGQGRTQAQCRNFCLWFWPFLKDRWRRQLGV